MLQLLESSGGHFGFQPEAFGMDENFSKVLLARLDTPSQVKATLLSPSIGKLDEFLEAMKSLQVAIAFFEENQKLASCCAELENGRSIEAVALEVLAGEFKSRLECASRRPHQSELTDAMKQQSSSASNRCLVDLVDPEQLPDLRLLAQRLMDSTEAERCRTTYQTCRANALRGTLAALRWSAVSAEEMRSLEWKELEKKMKQWNAFLNTTVSILLAGERSLVDDIFEDSLSVSDADRVFVESGGGVMEELIDFGEKAAEVTRSPERLISLLDMYETARDLRSRVQKLFCCQEARSVVHSFQAMLSSLGAAARATLAEFEELVENDGPRRESGDPERGEQGDRKVPSKVKIYGGFLSVKKDPFRDEVAADGDVHRLTSYVANYIKLISDKELYLHILEVIFGSRQMLVQCICNILKALKVNLEKKGDAFNDAILKELFLVNNLHYVNDKFIKCDAKDLLGPRWIDDTRKEVDDHLDKYRQNVVTKFQSILGDEENQKPDQQSIIRKLKFFNAALDEFVTKQRNWKVRDDDLRTLLTGDCIFKLDNMLKEFKSSHREALEKVKSSKARVLSSQEIDFMLSHSFGQRREL